MSPLRQDKVLTFADRRQWRAWLRTNHLRGGEAWLALPKRGHQGKSVSYEQAVEEALCFGWIDGLLHKLDETRFLLRFTPRRAWSIWSQSNKQRVARLIRQKRMTAWGMAKVREAKRSGQWREAERREQTDRPPADLLAELRKRRGHLAAWRALSVTEEASSVLAGERQARHDPTEAASPSRRPLADYRSGRVVAARWPGGSPPSLSLCDTPRYTGFAAESKVGCDDAHLAALGAQHAVHTQHAAWRVAIEYSPRNYG